MAEPVESDQMNTVCLIRERTTQLIDGLAAFCFFVCGVVYLRFGHWPVAQLDYYCVVGTGFCERVS